jgi:hypothetical protein
MLHRNRSGLRFATLAAALWCLVDAGGASAQINPFGRNSRFDLTQEDMQLMSRAASGFNTAPVKPGQKAAWDNPTSGTSGTIEIVGTYEKQGMPCQKRRYEFRNEKTFGRSSYVLDICKLPSGEWKIV